MAMATERVDWLRWYERWEQMLSCYNPGREARIHLLLTIPDLPETESPRILDLGAGPGSTGLSVLRQHPKARIMAVEADPLMVLMGHAVVNARGLAERFEYLHADIRDGSWWPVYANHFDLVVSATALHWLNADHYREVCRRAYGVLKPGGWFMNCDHVASRHPDMQERYRTWRDQRVERAFSALGADRWDSYWRELREELAGADAAPIECVGELWEGSDDGLAKPIHLDALEQAGFDLADIYWQELGEAILGGRKPG